MQPTSTTPKPLTNEGVTGPPGGLGTGVWWGITAGSIVVFSLLFWLAHEPLSASMGHVAPSIGQGGGANESQAVASEGDPSAVDGEGSNDRGASPGVPADEAPVVTPDQPAWTLVDVSQAVKEAGEEIEALIEEGQSELPEFQNFRGDPRSGDSPQASRERERFTAWGQIWRNRVSIVSERLPPEDACSVHAAMEPACRSLRSVLWTLESVAGADDLEAAEERIDLAAEKLDLFLNPPAPEEDEPLDEDLEASGDDGQLSPS